MDIETASTPVTRAKMNGIAQRLAPRVLYACAFGIAIVVALSAVFGGFSCVVGSTFNWGASLGGPWIWFTTPAILRFFTLPGCLISGAITFAAANERPWRGRNVAVLILVPAAIYLTLGTLLSFMVTTGCDL